MVAKSARTENLSVKPDELLSDPKPPVWIEVDLAAIQYNLQQIRQFVGPAVQVLSVVKANAYGHGLAPVAQALVEAGTNLLGVASVAEGVALRRDGVQAKILVLGQLLPEEAPLVAQHQLTQAIGDAAVAKALSRAAALTEQPVAVHIKVDTGMGRYGVWHEEAPALAQQILQLPGLKLEGVLTHLASAGQSSDATQVQLERFAQVTQNFQKAKLPMGIQHIANSVGLVKFPAIRADMVRTGLLVYGVSPIKGGTLPFQLRPALALKSRIRFIKTIAAGQRVSYGGTYQAARPTCVATVPVGYAHGYTRALSNKAQVLIRGHRAAVIGRITMEDLMVDATDVPGGAALGDEVTLIGAQDADRITAEELAIHARTIPYEILAGLSAALPRFYVNHPAPAAKPGLLHLK